MASYSRLPILLLTVGAAMSCFGQLSADQKKADFRELADRFAKNYAPYEWKKTAVKFDAFQIGPWLTRAGATKDDLEYYDLCVEYVSSLFDAHDYYRLPSTFTASLGFTVDIFDGKVLIDSIDTVRLPAAVFAAKEGDELVSVDGKTAEEWMKQLARYALGGNMTSNRRDAAGLMVSRAQAVYPYAHKIGDEAEVVFKNEAGEAKTVKLPWRKRGTALETMTSPAPIAMAATVNRGIDDNDPQGYLKYLENKANLLADTRWRAMVRGYGVKEPVFTLPAEFEATVGLGRTDTVYGGIITYQEKKIGYLRLAQFSGAGAARQVRDALTSFKDRTDALVLDVTRNPGGSACMVEEVAGELMTEKWQVQGAEQMVKWRDILAIQSSLDFARLVGDAASVAILEFDLAAYEKAFREGRTRTAPIPFCGTSIDKEPPRAGDGAPRAYAKPVLVLIDEFSTSAAEHLAALLQDNGRAKLFGKRTTGAGGAVITLSTGPYAEGQTSITWTLTNRSKNVVTTEYPEAPYIENIGVRPDIEFEMNTAENLKAKGKVYVEAFLQAVMGLMQ
ncbi:MAG: S41 family peptidase [Bryobacteraceae bacterium]